MGFNFYRAAPPPRGARLVAADPLPLAQRRARRRRAPLPRVRGLQHERNESNVLARVPPGVARLERPLFPTRLQTPHWEKEARVFPQRILTTFSIYSKSNRKADEFNLSFYHSHCSHRTPLASCQSNSKYCGSTAASLNPAVILPWQKAGCGVRRVRSFGVVLGNFSSCFFTDFAQTVPVA